MKISPYLYFNGNAAEAIALYERAFGGKAIVMRYRDVGSYDKSYTVPKGTEDYVMHANMNLGSEMIMCCDTPEKTNAGDCVQLLVMLESTERVKAIFATLKEGGIVVMEPQKTFWSECFCSVKDKFGVCWLLSYENATQKSQTYGE